MLRLSQFSPQASNISRECFESLGVEKSLYKMIPYFTIHHGLCTGEHHNNAVKFLFNQKRKKKERRSRIWNEQLKFHGTVDYLMLLRWNKVVIYFKSSDYNYSILMKIVHEASPAVSINSAHIIISKRPWCRPVRCAICAWPSPTPLPPHPPKKEREKKKQLTGSSSVWAKILLVLVETHVILSVLLQILDKTIKVLKWTYSMMRYALYSFLCTCSRCPDRWQDGGEAWDSDQQSSWWPFHCPVVTVVTCRPSSSSFVGSPW